MPNKHGYSERNIMTFDRTKTLEELEDGFWQNTEVNSHLVNECHRLRKIPLANLTIENLKVLIGQKIGVNFLIPLVIEFLELNPLSEGEMYKVDLILMVASIDDEFWDKNPELNNRMMRIKNELEILSATITEKLLPVLNKFS